ncbi:hypothetical protein BDP55DRAFT_632292 [Colletotrichum godetiae]|uniref:Uncharacterized protein n=1 Tax=Colletotrichum godetiae TaxID=1209918 RepID=A0AAJ0ETJ7_9PEZI|nr:uncharacterized protein BDP55DRAFT_632292 [Colletotrichum godetiae]KAK1675112.1 hypothetical protein BDP55DRAFT_632292 [Colletotrichum godetiae]
MALSALSGSLAPLSPLAPLAQAITNMRSRKSLINPNDTGLKLRLESSNTHQCHAPRQDVTLGATSTDGRYPYLNCALAECKIYCRFLKDLQWIDMTSPSLLRHAPYTAESNGYLRPLLSSPIPSAQRTMARWRLDRQRPNRSWSPGLSLASPGSYVKWIGHNSQSNHPKASRSRRQIREEEEKTLLDLFASGGRVEERGGQEKARRGGKHRDIETLCARHRNVNQDSSSRGETVLSSPRHQR